MPEKSNETVLAFEGVTVSFDSTKALDDVTFKVLPGETCVLFGAAGSGKTVLLKTALGLDHADSGHVCVFGNDITRMRERDLFEIRSHMGVLFQEGGLFDSLTIEENVGYPLANLERFRLPADQVRAKAAEALRFVELEHTLDKFPSELSGGMRRRVGIARAIATEPALVLYDSPTAGLDPITAYTIVALILKQRDIMNTATVMATHRFQDGHFLATNHYDPKTARAEPVSDQQGAIHTRFIVLREGRLIFDGSLDELMASKDSYISKFVRHEE